MSEPLPEPQRSPERQRLAEAIAHLGGLDSQLGRLAEARGRLGLRDKERVLDSARRGVAEARGRAPAIVVAKAMGESFDPAATVDHAENLLAAAQRDVDEATAAVGVLSDEIRVVEGRREVAQIARDHAVAEVVKSSPEVVALCARIEQTRQQLHAFAWILSAIGLGRLPPEFFWDGIVHGRDNDHAGAPWRAAIAALEQDADAELPPG